MQRWDTDVLPEAKVNLLLGTQKPACMGKDMLHAITDVQESSCFALGATCISVWIAAPLSTFNSYFHYVVDCQKPENY